MQKNHNDCAGPQKMFSSRNYEIRSRSKLTYQLQIAEAYGNGMQNYVSILLK